MNYQFQPQQIIWSLETSDSSYVIDEVESDRIVTEIVMGQKGSLYKMKL